MHRRSFAVLFVFFLAVTTTSHQWCFAEEALGHNPSVQQRNRRVTPTRIFVSTQGSDQSTGTRRAPFRTIQHALNVAVVPGDKVLVRGGVYRERIQFPASGNRNGGPITLRGYGKERVTLRAPVSASSQEGQDLILIKNRNYIRVMELEIAYNFNVNDGAGIRVDSNEIHRCNVGIEIGAQNQGGDSHHILVRNNLIHRNDNAGISLGGYVANAGRVRQCRFLNNTLFRNDRDAYANGRAGQIGIRYAHDNVFANNIVWGNNAGVMLRSEPVAENNRFNHNLWYLLGGEMQAEFIWGGDSFFGLGEFRMASNQAVQGIFTDPLFESVYSNGYVRGDGFQLLYTSPAINTGYDLPGWFAPLDFLGLVRSPETGVDRGAIQYTP